MKLGFLFLGFVLVLWGCGIGNQTGRGTDVTQNEMIDVTQNEIIIAKKGNMNLLSHTGLGYKLFFPGTWNIDLTDKESSLLKAMIEYNSETETIEARIMVHENPEGLPLAPWVQQYDKVVGNFPSSLTLDEHNALLFTVDGGGGSLSDYFIEVGQYILEVQCSLSFTGEPVNLYSQCNDSVRNIEFVDGE